jgi:hypothetical protein
MYGFYEFVKSKFEIFDLRKSNTSIPFSGIHTNFLNKLVRLGKFITNGLVRARPLLFQFFQFRNRFLFLFDNISDIFEIDKIITVTRIPPTTTEDQLLEWFSAFGEIKHVRGRMEEG